MALRGKNRERGLSDRLAELGLSVQQVGSLVELVAAMRGARNVPPAPIRDVKASVARTRDAARILHRDASVMFENARGGAAQAEAAHRILAGVDQVSAEEWLRLESLPRSLERLAAACDQAIADLPRERYSTAAHWLPVAKIWEALTVDPAAAIEPSRAPGSIFRQVCAICFESISGVRDHDPDRAIRAFLQQRKKSGTRAPRKT